MSSILTEGRLSFEFPGEAIKFDEDPFYRDIYSHQPEAKGVDFLVAMREAVLFIEVKDCFGHESENRWRLDCDNKSLHKANPGQSVSGRDSLDLEVSKKTASSIACLYGAFTKKQIMQKSESMEHYFAETITKSIQDLRKRIVVILLLEGEFATHSRTKKMIMKSIQDSIKKKLQWLNCSVSVTDKDNTDEKNNPYFSVKRL